MDEEIFHQLDTGVIHSAEVLKIAEEIERKRIKMGKTSGFEKQYHRVVRLYFGGMARHLKNLQPFLKKGAMLDSVDLFRTRFATATKKGMNEEVVVLKWKG